MKICHVFPDPLRGAALLFLSAFILAASAAEKKKPNILLIVTDDQGYADYSLSEFSKPEVKTPRMDALLKSGARFSHAHTSGVTCAPTRAGIMTGNYQQRHGLYHTPDSRLGLDAKAKLMPEYLKEAGYATACFGKWHLGLTDEFNPVSRGFDEFYGFLGHGGHDYFKLEPPPEDRPGCGMFRNLEPISDKGYLTTRIGDETVDWIKRQRDQPWFAYVCFNAVHSPAQAPAEDVARFDTGDPKRDKLMAMLMHLDSNIGRIMDTLKEVGDYEDTVVFLLTDNGGAKAMNADNRPLRGAKGSVWEGGHRTFFGVSWPGKIKADTVIDTPVMSFDVLPTALEAANLPIDSERIKDGRSLLPVIAENGKEVHDHLVWDNARGPIAVIQGGWKLVRDQSGRKPPVDHLFHLSDDPSEEKDLAGENPQKLKELLEIHQVWRKQMKPLSSRQKKSANFQKPKRSGRK